MKSRTFLARYLLLISLLLAVLLAACGDPTVTPANTTIAATTAPASTTQSAPGVTATVGNSSPGASTARFEDAKCPMTLPSGVTEGKDLRCGFVSVPELHAKPGGKTIRLFVTIAKGKDVAANATPVVVLAGGPGQGGSSLLPILFNPQLPDAQLLQGRDLILLDQRGTGYSQPALTCSEEQELTKKYAGKNAQGSQYVADSVAAYAACRERLAKEGVNLAAFNSVENAADVNTLRQALNLPKVDLYGVSYGSRLALTVMRDYPQAIRSVVIASPFPLQADLLQGLGVSFDNALNELFKTCAADAECNQTFPDLKATFNRVYKQLEEKPVKLMVKELENTKTHEVLLDGDLMVNSVYQLLFISPFIGVLPAAIGDAEKGNYNGLAVAISASYSIGGSISRGMYYSVNCQEEFAFTDTQNLQKSQQALLPQVVTALADLGPSTFETCKKWGVDKAMARENEPVKSDIPTLIISGQFDPITPPNYGQEAAKTLSKSTVVTLPGQGHSPVEANVCGVNLVKNFFGDPTKTLDTGCSKQSTLKFAKTVPDLGLIVK
jgi:pimeloyl-ACP methyl ester carboxylesterase